MEGNTVVIDDSGGVNCPLEKSVPLVTVELELERFHCGIITQWFFFLADSRS
jgi:hypothetical protein